jgi:hypothetical protein
MQIGAVLASSTVAVSTLEVVEGAGRQQRCRNLVDVHGHADLVDVHARMASTAGGAPPRRAGAAPHLVGGIESGIGTLPPGRTVLLSSIRRCFAL